jgi:hypothetical protein
MSAVQHIPTASSTIPASIPEFKMSSLEEINRERAVAAKLQPNHISTRESAIPPPTPKRPNAQTDMPSIGTYSVVECRAANSGAHSRSHFHPSDISPIARSVCTFSSPSQWLTNCESTIQHWTTASRALAREETKRRTLVAVNMLAELNEYLSGIRSKEERKRYRGLLEGERFEKALLKMKTVCNGSVMLRKQVEVYEDDKEDDVAG